MGNKNQTYAYTVSTLIHLPGSINDKIKILFTPFLPVHKLRLIEWLASDLTFDIGLGIIEEGGHLLVKSYSLLHDVWTIFNIFEMIKRKIYMLTTGLFAVKSLLYLDFVFPHDSPI